MYIHSLARWRASCWLAIKAVTLWCEHLHSFIQSIIHSRQPWSCNGGLIWIRWHGCIWPSDMWGKNGSMMHETLTLMLTYTETLPVEKLKHTSSPPRNHLLSLRIVSKFLDFQVPNAKTEVAKLQNPKTRCVETNLF